LILMWVPLILSGVVAAIICMASSMRNSFIVFFLPTAGDSR
jgi:hypothetical protein